VEIGGRSLPGSSIPVLILWVFELMEKVEEEQVNLIEILEGGNGYQLAFPVSLIERF